MAPPKSTQEDDLVPFNFRIRRALLDELDKWAEELNKGRRGPKITRSDLVRGVLDWAAENRPDWEQRGG